MIYREHLLPPPLRRAFLCAWDFALEPADPPVVQHSIPPDGTSNLSLTRARDGTLHRRLVGPSLVGVVVPVMQGWTYRGFRLRPEAQASVLGGVLAPGSMILCDGEDALAPLWRSLATFDWSDAVRQFGGRAGGDDVVARAVDEIMVTGGRRSVAELAAAAALSERQFRRRFRAATGIGAKQFGDVQRMRRALILSLEDADWAGVAIEAGFADQPHLARDLKDRFGTPTAQVGGYFGGMRHQLLAPAAVSAIVRNLQDPQCRAA